MPTTIIPPSIGRSLYFREGPGQPVNACILIDVHAVKPATLIAVQVFYRNGMAQAQFDVPLVQDGEDVPGGPHCVWMPFQVGQAKTATTTERTPFHAGPEGGAPTTGGMTPKDQSLA